MHETPTKAVALKLAIRRLILWYDGSEAQVPEMPDVGAGDSAPTSETEAQPGSLRIDVSAASALEGIWGKFGAAWSQLADEVQALIDASSGGGSTYMIETYGGYSPITHGVNDSPLTGVLSANFDTTLTAQPDVCRTIRVQFGPGWDGGNVGITGVTADGTGATEEVIVALAGSSVDSVRAYSGAYRVRNLGNRTAGTVQFAGGPKLGLPKGSGTITIHQVVKAGVDLVVAGYPAATVDAYRVIQMNSAFGPDGPDYSTFVIAYTLAS